MKRSAKSFTQGKLVDIEVLMTDFLQKHKLSNEILFKNLEENFQLVVGKQIAEHTKPEKISKGILHLKVDNSVWKSELFLQKKAIIAKCNSILGTPTIQDIRFF